MFRILKSLTVIIGLAAMASYVTWSQYQDVEVSGAHSLNGGEMDLKIDDQNLNGTQKFIVEGLYPGKEDYGDVKVSEEGGLVGGKLYLSLEDIADNEVSLLEQEREMGDNWDSGELCDQLQFKITNPDENITYMNWKNTRDITDRYLTDLSAGGEKTLRVHVRVKTSAGNEIMTDRCTFKTKLTLIQNP